MRPGVRPYFIWCGELSGFGLRVFPSGKRTYYANYRNRDGVRRRMALGPHGKLTADEARKLAVVAFAGALKGGGPAAERATRRNTLTVGELCDKYMQAAEGGLIVGKRGRPKKASTLYNDQGRIQRHIKPLLGTKRVHELTQADVNRFMRDVAAGKTAVVEKTAKARGKAVVTGGLGRFSIIVRPSLADNRIKITLEGNTFNVDARSYELSQDRAFRRYAERFVRPLKKDRN